MSGFGQACILTIGLSLPMWAQQPGKPAPTVGNPQVSAAPGAVERQIPLDVVVTDKAGKPVPGLQKQDFTLLDNKQPQNIVFFKGVQADSGAPPPATQVVLVIDGVNTAFDGIAYERQQLDRFFQANGGKVALPTSLIMFNDSGVKMQNAPSQDGATLASILDQTANTLRTINRSQGFYGAGDRLQLSLNALGRIVAYETQQPGRKLLIWIGPGWPILSGPNIILTNKQEQGIFNSIVSITNGMRQAGVTLYNTMPLAVGGSLSRLLYYEAFLKPVSKSSQAQEGSLSLQVLADQSGGRVLNENSDLASQIKSCMSDADAFYTLTFDSQPADKPNDFHALKVTVDKPGVNVRTRVGYYAQP